MQYDYQEWAGDPAGYSFEFYIERPYRIFVNDLLGALKALSPVTADMPDYDAEDYGRDLYLDIDTVMGPFTLRKEYLESSIQLRADGNQLFEEIARLLAEDINFNKVPCPVNITGM